MERNLLWHGLAPIRWARQRRGQQGSAAVEYALLAVLIAVACVLALDLLGGSVVDKYSQVASSLARS